MKKIREIVIDTETTGINPQKGDKLVEIGAVELLNGKPTGRVFQQYINPHRSVPKRISAIHGLDANFLRRYPSFKKIAPQFLQFIGKDSVLVAHNASFDLDFLNCELKNAGYQSLYDHQIVDTLSLARQAFPEQRNTLDCLCNRFHIDNSMRILHGALLDARLLAEVYQHLRPRKFAKLRKWWTSVKQFVFAPFADNRQIQRIIY